MKGPKVKEKVGDYFQTQTSGVCQLVHYKDSYNVTVKFEDGSLVTTSLVSVRTGKVKNLNQPKIHKVGFFGVGPHKARLTGEKNVTKEYAVWASMMQRCYDMKFQEKRPTYKGCSVDPQWHNFQEFAEWCQWQKGFGLKGWELDKDILGEGNLYSPETCCFVPTEINSFNGFKGAVRGLTEVSKTKYTVSLTLRGCRTYLGTYSSYEDAAKVSKTYQQEQVKYLIDKYLDDLCIDTVLKLYTYTYTED